MPLAGRQPSTPRAGSPGTRGRRGRAGDAARPGTTGLPVVTDGGVTGFVDRLGGLVDGSSHRELVAVSSGYGGACVAFAGNELRGDAGAPTTSPCGRSGCCAWGLPLLGLVARGAWSPGGCPVGDSEPGAEHAAAGLPRDRRPALQPRPACRRGAVWSGFGTVGGGRHTGGSCLPPPDRNRREGPHPPRALGPHRLGVRHRAGVRADPARAAAVRAELRVGPRPARSSSAPSRSSGSCSPRRAAG